MTTQYAKPVQKRTYTTTGLSQADRPLHKQGLEGPLALGLLTPVASPIFAIWIHCPGKRITNSPSNSIDYALGRLESAPLAVPRSHLFVIIRNQIKKHDEELDCALGHAKNVLRSAFGTPKES